VSRRLCGGPGTWNGSKGTDSFRIGRRRIEGHKIWRTAGNSHASPGPTIFEEPASMRTNTLARELEEGLAEIPMFDIHTHLVGGNLSARGLHDILLYHMVVSDLYGAGCPTGARLTQYPAWPTQQEAQARIQEALAYLGVIRNTSSYWGVRLILKDLYGWREPITPDNWR